jgi:hypothetical protein
LTTQLEKFYGTLVRRGTPVEKPCFKRTVAEEEKSEKRKKMGKSYQYAMQPICHFYLGTKNKCKGGFSIYLNFQTSEDMLNSRFQYGKE